MTSRRSRAHDRPEPGETDTFGVVFVCTGNICRSPMAEFIARGRAERELDVPARFSSAGTSDEEDGNPVDPRAARQLRAAGYATGGHVAHRITGAEIAAADLIVGMEEHHVRALRRSAPGADVRLLSEFDPGARPGQGVPDPWYGGQEGFERTAAAIEAAIPGIFAHIRRFATGAADAV